MMRMLIFKKSIVWAMFLWSFQSIAFQEFLYPVGIIQHEGREKICVLYQKNSHLELWFWDPESLEAIKGLLSSYTPGGVNVLPNQAAFSFIDNDRIRIKDLSKRSPGNLDLPYGPYDLSTIEWIDNQSFYFSARFREHLNLFHATKEGELFYLTRSNSAHYSYPQKIENTLFYLVKNNEEETTIEQAQYPVETLPKRTWDQEQNFKEQLKKLFEEENDTFTKTYLDTSTQKKLYSWSNPEKELAFLFMKDANKGYFLTHPATIGHSDNYMTFECYTFECDSEVMPKKLFSFDIPLHLLMPKHNQPERLYESILPLLPMYYDDAVYYTHDSGLGLRIYKYHEINNKSEVVTESHSYSAHHFAPLCYGNKIYYGGTISHGDDLSHTSPEMFINEKGKHNFDLPNL